MPTFAEDTALPSFVVIVSEANLMVCVVLKSEFVRWTLTKRRLVIGFSTLIFVFSKVFPELVNTSFTNTWYWRPTNAVGTFKITGDEIAPESIGQVNIRISGYDMDYIGLKLEPQGICVRHFVPFVGGMQTAEDFGFAPEKETTTQNNWEAETIGSAGATSGSDF